MSGAVRAHFSSICPSPGARKGGIAPGDCFWGLPGANQVAGAPGSGVPVMGTLTRARKPCCRAWLLCGDLGVEAGGKRLMDHNAKIPNFTPGGKNNRRYKLSRKIETGRIFFDSALAIQEIVFIFAIELL